MLAPRKISDTILHLEDLAGNARDTPVRSIRIRHSASGERRAKLTIPPIVSGGCTSCNQMDLLAGGREVTLDEVDGRSIPVRLRDGAARLLQPYL